MLSILFNSRIKSWKNWRTPWKNTKNLNLFIKIYNWEGINYTSEKDDGKKFEKINLMIALNVSYAKKEKIIYPAYASKHNSNHEKKQTIFLMISSWDGWHYIAIEKLPALLRRIMSKNCNFCYLNCLYSFRRENKLESHKNVYENKDCCNVVMPSIDTKILEFNQYQKSDKAPFIIYYYFFFPLFFILQILNV